MQQVKRRKLSFDRSCIMNQEMFVLNRKDRDECIKVMKRHGQERRMLGFFFFFYFFRVKELEKQVKKAKMLLRNGRMPLSGDKSLGRRRPQCSQQCVCKGQLKGS